jgi:hypothetical protein
VPDQKRLDGLVVGTEVVRQFVAMPLGTGYTIESQLKEGASFKGGLQFEIVPLNTDLIFIERWFRPPTAVKLEEKLKVKVEELLAGLGEHNDARLLFENQPIPSGRNSYLLYEFNLHADGCRPFAQRLQYTTCTLGLHYLI